MSLLKYNCILLITDSDILMIVYYFNKISTEHYNKYNDRLITSVFTCLSSICSMSCLEPDRFIGFQFRGMTCF